MQDTRFSLSALLIAAVFVGQFPNSLAVVADEPTPETQPTGEKYKLAYRWQSGQVLRYELTNETRIETQLQASNQVDFCRSEVVRSFEVTNVTDKDLAKTQAKIERVKMSVAFNDGDWRLLFNSEDPSTYNEKFQHVIASLGRTTSEMTVGQHGEMVEFKQLLEFAQDPGSVPVGGAPTSSEGSWFSYLPSHEVTVGESWKQRFEQRVTEPGAGQLVQKVVMLRIYKLREVTGNRATIEFATAIITPVSDVEIEKQLMLSETKGTMVFDLELGQVVERDWAAERTVLNAAGANSSVRGKTKFSERLLADAPPAANAGEPAQARESTEPAAVPR